MSDAERGVDARVAALRAAFADALPARVSALREAWDGLRRGEWDPERYRAAMRLAHGLAGAGATFGFPRVSAAAAAAERALQRAVDRGAPLSPARRRALDADIAELSASLPGAGR